MASDLIELFLDAIKVDALSLRERPMADFVRRTLAGLPVEVREDNTASLFNGECGNLVCVPFSFNPTRPAIALLAHLDTPRSTADVRPVLSDVRIESDGTTALGVDNRAGTSILLHALREHLMAGVSGNFIVVFTVAEELGPFGSKYIDLSPYSVKSCFVFDCSKRPGTYIRAAVGCAMYNATFIGTSSHAGVAPEKGVNAIRIAAVAISRIPIGRLSSTMTSNVGMIVGGTATNVVPDRCTLQGEVRAFDAPSINTHLEMLRLAFGDVAAEHHGCVEFTTSLDFAPFVLDPASDVVKLTEDVLQSVGLAPHPIKYLGGSDANMLNAKGIPSVNLGIGAQNPHGNDEFILLEDLKKSAEIAHELFKRSATLT